MSQRSKSLLLVLLTSGSLVGRARASDPDAGLALPLPASALRSALDAGTFQGDLVLQRVPASAAELHEGEHPHGEDEHPHEHRHEHEHVIVHSHEHAHDADDTSATAYGAVARARQLRRAASSRIYLRRELPHAPNVQAADLLRVVPGLHVIQHAGGGKANQYFLRGFDIDHGTDLALSFDGVPINMVSHGHGQGYADLNWLIPELVGQMEVAKGPYDPRFGDFATAGAVDLQTSSVTPESRLTLQGGMFHTFRALGIVGTDIDELRLSGAAELYGSDGPFQEPQQLRRYNLFTRAAYALSGGELSLTATGYGSSWDASGQIPLRAVRAGTLDSFGSVDPHEGGSSTRHSLYARYRSSPRLPQRWELLGYLVRYRFSLYSNFTLFSEDPSAGDMIHQRDERTLAGFKARYARDDRLGPLTLGSRVGFELRHDEIDNGLDRAPARELGAALVSAQIGESSLGVFVEEEVEWLPWLRSSLALRGDWFGFAVRDQLEDRDTLGTKTSGERSRAQLSPKGALVITPREWLELYGNVGLGFHSNDARGVVQGVTPLTRALGYELGVRSAITRFATARLVAFRLDLASELVWVGDAGTTEPSGRTRREGLELDLRIEPLPWLFAELSLALTRARFRDAPSGEAAVPLAPSRTLSGSVTAQHPSGVFAKLSVLHLGDRPASEDRFLTAEGFTRADLSGGYRHPRFELALRLENLLNASYRESQFATVSRLPNESAGSCPPGTRAQASSSGSFAGCEDINFTPGFPFAAHASASVFF